MINFTRPWNGDGTLDFSSDENVAPKYPLDIAGVSAQVVAEQVVSNIVTFGVSALSAQAKASLYIEQIHQLGVVAQSNVALSSGVVENDINVDRGMKAETISLFSKADAVQNNLLSQFADSPKQQNINVHITNKPDYIANNIIAYQGDMPDLKNGVTVALRDGDLLQNAVSSINKRLGDATLDVVATIFDGDKVANYKSSTYNYPPRSDTGLSSAWLDAKVIQHQVDTDFDGQGMPIKRTWQSYYEDATDPTGNRPIIIDPPIEPPKPIISTLNFVDLWNGKGELDFLRIELDALIIMNTVIMYHTSKLGERTYINPVSWSVSNDLDSYAWTLNCSLYDNGILDLIATDDTFTLEVNGVKWNFNAFKYKRLQDGQFSGYSVTFVSKTQQLGYPSAQPMNVSLDAPKGAIQLVDEILGDISLVNKGVSEWTLQADTVEFMQAEPKAIISEILKATGAVMLPTVTGDKIMIQHRYKVASWLMDELDDIECDVLLDGNYMISDSGEIINGTEYNAVTISGEKSAVVTKVVLDGTDGATEAQDYTTQIHQDHNVGLEYAKKVFSESGTIELAEISVGLDDNLLQSGNIVRIKHANGDRTGVSLGVTVKGDTVENVIQTATIEFRL